MVVSLQIRPSNPLRAGGFECAHGMETTRKQPWFSELVCPRDYSHEFIVAIGIQPKTSRENLRVSPQSTGTYPLTLLIGSNVGTVPFR